MSIHTIFMYDMDTCRDVRLTMPSRPASWLDVWCVVLKDRLNADQLKALGQTEITRENVAEVLDEMGDDAMDFNIVAVIEGDVNSIGGELPEH